MNFRYIIPLFFFACETPEKDPDGLASYSCDLEVTGTDSEGNFQTLLESSSELDCVLSQEKEDLMDEACALDQENYIGEYSGVNCDWSCSVISECE